jgi:hypothetical protein
MKNFKSSGFYQKRIRIESAKQIETTFKRVDVLKFFPEGGNLVAGTSNKVVVIGPPSEVLKLKSPADSVVNLVTLDSTGFGSFNITPQSGVRYYAERPTGGRRWLLPVTEKDGLALVMDQKDDPEFVLSVGAGSPLSGKEVYAVVVSQGKIKFRQPVMLNESQPVRLTVPLQPNHKSIQELLVFESSGKILSRRLFFFKAANNVAVKLNVTNSINQRGRISGAIQVTDESGGSLESQVNVVVYQSKLFEKYPAASNFYLSELPAAAERAGKLGIVDNFLLNEFLITQSKDVLNWQDVINSRPLTLTFPFYSEPKLRGKVVAKDTGAAPPDSTAVIGYLQSNTVGYEAYTRGGNFAMTLIYDFWGEDKVFCTIESKNKVSSDNYNIVIVKDSIGSLIIGPRWKRKTCGLW